MSAITRGNQGDGEQQSHRRQCKRPAAVAFVWHMRFLVSLLPLAAGCAMGGALHQAQMFGQCNPNDAACSRRHPQAPIAVGTHFHPEVEVELAGTSTPNLRLESAAPDVIAVDDGVLLAKAAGTSAVLISTDDGSVVDFVHVWAAPATKITLARRDGERVVDAIAMPVGEDLTLVPTLWNGAQRLAGDAEVEWTSTSPTTLSIMRDGSPERRRLRARAPGKTTLTVALGDTKTSIDIEVVP